jgi:hypothetical protein
MATYSEEALARSQAALGADAADVRRHTEALEAAAVGIAWTAAPLRRKEAG